MQKLGSLNLSRRVYDPKVISEQHVAMHGKTGICVYSCITSSTAYGSSSAVTPQPLRHQGQTCHAGIRRSAGLSELVSNYGGEHKYSKEWWDYITGPECFYQDFFKVPGWEILTDSSDQMIAFKVPDALVKEGMSLLFYAFLIETRAPKDKIGNVNVWGRLVAEGVPKKVAHMMMYYLSEKGDQLAIGGPLTGGWTGGHQVVCDTGNTDWGMFYRNEVRRNVAREEFTRELWSKGQGKVLSSAFSHSFGTPVSITTNPRYGGPKTEIIHTLSREGLSSLSKHIENTCKNWK